jgi:dTDP-4-amino-4,6-dideoxygalactose transaminase
MSEKIWLSSPTMHGEEEKFVKEAFDTTVNPVSYEGGEQVFIDSERDT